MKNLCILCLVSLVIACQPSSTDVLISKLGKEEYTRLISLSMDDFDQSKIGFRQYSGDYHLVQLLIPEYIRINKLSSRQSRNLHWHLGQIHAFNEEYSAAIDEMKQSYDGGGISWSCYVSGSIAFLEKDMDALKEAYDTLYNQDNVMNIEFLEKFIKYFDRSYAEAYNAPL